MVTPFNSIASRYAELWSEDPRGRSQRAQVWREIDPLFEPAQRILDLGCGIGDDALHLGERGVHVTGIDSAERMVEIARASGADARHLAIENLAQLNERFDGALANFGSLNCVEDLGPVAKEIARLVRPGGALAICVLGRFSWRETLHSVAELDLATATRRWSGRAEWRGMAVYYRSGSEWRRVLAPAFELHRRVSIGGGDHQLYIFQRRRS